MNNNQSIIRVDDFAEYYHYRHSSDFVFEGHRHTQWEINIILNGEMEITYEGRIISLKENDLFLCEPNSFHRNRVLSKNGAEQIVYQFYSNDLTPTGAPKIYSIDNYSKNLMQLIKEECEITKYFNGEFNLNINYKAKILLELLLTRLSLSKENQNVSVYEKDKKIFSVAVQYMNDNINSKISIKEVAEKCCVSEAKLKKVFAKYTGIGVINYFSDIKLNKAKELLKSGKNVGETSGILGFSSQAYFSLWFKKNSGASPFKYINS